MELKVSSPKSGCLPSSDCAIDPEEKEISDDDDDRNHKHRRRGAHSESLEGDPAEPLISKPFRKWNRPFGSEGSDLLKTYNVDTGEKEFSSKFDRKRSGLTVFPQTSNINQRMRGNQFFYGEQAISRGRGRVNGSWNQQDPRFNSVDVAAQLVQQGSVPPRIYTSSGLANIMNTQSASWNGFGLIPGIPNGGLDMLHSVKLQASLRPPINPSLSIGIPRQRCRDFEERGFCLRGDMCPMEHGVNRIVVEDVQSLSQFNLPVSLPSGHQVGMSAGLRPSQPGNASTTSMNVKGNMGKACKTGINDDDMAMDGAIPDTACASGSDFYDPDQPLWNDHGLETSNGLLSMQSPGLDEPKSSAKEAPSDQLHVRVRDVTNSDSHIGSVRTSAASQHTSSSVWARITAPRNKFDKENVNLTRSTFQYHEAEIKEGKDEFSGVQTASHQGNGMNDGDNRLNNLDKPFKNQSDKQWNVRKSSQKAHRTLFVSGVPQKSNKKEALLCHFQKFGEVIGIHIPINSERAFVQFSKREEAEAALQAPDAVMGNRFIKLWWANRDSIPDDGVSNSTGVSVIPYDMLPSSVTSHPISTGSGKDFVHQISPLKGVTDMVTGSDHPKPVLSNVSKVPPTLQKKLEQLKEDIRKKQEMLDQKRDIFLRQLDKLEKQASGLKVEMVEHGAKRLKVGPADGANSVSPRSSNSGSAVLSPHAEASTDKEKSAENAESHCPKTTTNIVAQETATVKESIGLLPIKKHKSEKPYITFRIVPPLPEGLANDAALKDHFSSYADLSGIELEDLETDNGGSQSNELFNCSARISFATQLAAERAFNEGACWRGYNLKFMWLTSSSPDDIEGKGPSSPKGHSDHCFAATEELACEATDSTVCEGEPENFQLKTESEQS